jgi:putative SOS response-associated peptidase YedK
MCGRYAFSASAVQQLARAFRAEQVAALTPRLNHAPTQSGPVAVRRPGQSVSIERLRWGLVVPWTAAPLINAQSETAAQKPTFRHALEKQRCLIPADAFYEWQDDTKPKQPWEFRLADGEPLVFAGLWHTGTLPSGERVDAYCILTTQANDTLRRCHDRMPVILREADWEPWLSPSLPVSPAQSLQVFFRPWPGPMLARPVTTKINKAAYDGPVEEVKPQAPAAVVDDEPRLF